MPRSDKEIISKEIAEEGCRRRFFKGFSQTSYIISSQHSYYFNHGYNRRLFQQKPTSLQSITSGCLEFFAQEDQISQTKTILSAALAT